jgi:YhcH/YjgK/YiaL family protein
MIVDTLQNISTYAVLGKKIAVALEYLKTTDFSAMPDGRYDIRGDEIYAVVQRYETKPREQGRWEAHRKYIDIQFLAEGCELIGVVDAEKLTIAEEYDAESDIMFFADAAGDLIKLTGSKFVLLFPQDAHMPGIASGTPSDVTKAVVKILV